MTEQQLEALAGMVAKRVLEELAQVANKRYLSRDEFASETGLGVRTIDRMIAEGRLSAVKEGRRVLIPKDEMSRLGVSQGGHSK